MRLDIPVAYLWTKFNHSSFRGSRDTVGADQNLNGLGDLSGMVCHPRASTCYVNLYVSTKFEASNFTHYGDTNNNAKYRKWGGLGYLWVTQGRWKLRHLTERMRVPISIP